MQGLAGAHFLLAAGGGGAGSPRLGAGRVCLRSQPTVSALLADDTGCVANCGELGGTNAEICQMQFLYMLIGKDWIGFGFIL